MFYDALKLHFLLISGTTKPGSDAKAEDAFDHCAIELRQDFCRQPELLELPQEVQALLALFDDGGGVVSP